MSGAHFALDEQIAMIEAFHREHRRPYRVARYFPNRSLQGITRWLVAQGLHRRTRRNPAWKLRDIDTLVHLWNTDVPVAEIAPKVGHSANAVFQFAEKNRKRLKLKSRKSQAILPGQLKAIAREFEMALSRSQLATGRTRGSCVRHGVEYLMREGGRKKKRAIEDVGGMVQLNSPGPKRKAAA